MMSNGVVDTVVAATAASSGFKAFVWLRNSNSRGAWK